MNKIRLLCLIDDDQIYQLATRRLLEKYQFANQILAFANGEEAIHYLKFNAHNTDALPEVIFLDIHMPHMDGWEFMEAFSEVKGALVKPVNIFMVSASIAHADITQAKSISDVTDYLVKPITQDQMVHTMALLGK